MPRVFGPWRATTIAAAILGFATTNILLPRSGLVYAVGCVDRSSGKLLCVREGLRAPRTAVHGANSQTTPTAATDGQRVFAYFARQAL
jgi:hypothetical protein